MKRVVCINIVLALVVTPARGQTADQKKATIAYLQKLQNKDGGFRPSAGVEKSSLRATSAALRALKYFGGETPDRAAAAEFVKKCYDKATGGFADEPGGKPDVVATSIGIMAVVELKLPLEPYGYDFIKYVGLNAKTFEDVRIAVAGFEAIDKMAPETKKWMKLVSKECPTFSGREEDGARKVAGATVALMRMGLRPGAELDEIIIRGLGKDRRKDGGFGKKGESVSDLESTYRVIRCFHMLKGPSNTAATLGRPEELYQFIAKCRNDDGGYGIAPGEKSGAGPTYFASIILHWLDEK